MLARCYLLPSFLLLFVAAPVLADGPLNNKVDYNRDIRPILSDNCFACHGPDARQRKADLRLDIREAVLAHDKVLVPGKSSESELIRRLVATDNKLMPPKKSGKSLTPAQIDLLRRWVDQGASYAQHWAFVPPVRSALPAVRQSDWPIRPIDYFVLARLEAAGLSPSPRADRVALIRRVTLDLTGLPPTPAEVDAFLADQSAHAYEKVVDRLLRSSRFGEHMGRYWLDLARFGDTHGLHLDNYREMWLYRDWVIRAFNDNKPFDEFVTAQLAGDLLPGAKVDDLIATGFNRAHVTTSEGGSITEEVHIRNVNDRVETAGLVFLGLTVGCARCHDHKYDPITQKDFYSLSAYFNSLEGSPLDGNAVHHPPVIKVPTPEQEKALADLDRQLAAARKAVADKAATLVYDDRLDDKASDKLERADFVWVEDSLPAGVKGEVNAGLNTIAWVSSPVHSGKLSLRITANGLNQHFFTGAKPGLKVGADDRLFAYVYLDPKNPPKEIMLQWHSDTWKHRAYWGQNLVAFGADNTTERRHMGPLPELGKWVRLEVSAAHVGLTPGTTITGLAFTQHDGVVYWDRAGLNTQLPQSGGSYETLSSWVAAQRALKGAGLPEPIKALIQLDRAKRTAEQHKQLRDYFVQNVWAKGVAELSPLRNAVSELEKKRKQLDEQIPGTYIFRETPTPRPAYVLKRGEYDQRGEKVERKILEFLNKMPADAPNNRLGLARWLLAPDNPLTARVAVNRFWQQLFGTGLVKTAEDFGVQGESPSHPELLDWLAVEFRESGWDVKKLMKLLVTSATYQQSARLTPDRLAKDPANVLLSRGPRFRLDAEMLRDQALMVSGLLYEKLGGPSVKPPQPAGLWRAVAFVGSNTMNFVADKGPDKVHRRSVYTFWKRTAPPPQMTTFDAPSREACVVRRERTNTPLQALLLLNEPQYLECARALAERALREGGKTTDEQITHLFRLATCRRPDSKELAELSATLTDLLATYAKEPAAAQKVIAVGETKADATLDPTRLAAWTLLASTVLNLDEVLNK